MIGGACSTREGDNKCTKAWLESLTRRDYSKDIDVDGRIKRRTGN